MTRNLEINDLAQTSIPTLEALAKLPSSELRRMALTEHLWLATACNHLANARDEWVLSQAKTPMYWRYIDNAKDAYTRACKDERGQVICVKAKLKEEVSFTVAT